MSRHRQTPVIVGVADIVNRSRKVEDAIEPLNLILEAVNNAIRDTDIADQGSFRSQIDSIDVVRNWTWPYPDLAKLIGEKLALKPRHTHNSEHGGNQPCKLLDDAARRISLGEAKVALIAGGEALASLTACAAAGKMPPPGWTAVDEDVKSVFSPTTRKLQLDVGSKHYIGNPVQVYPLLENSFRAYRGQSIEQNHNESAELYAEFAQVAQHQPYSWSYGSKVDTKETIGTINKKNRMICTPYPLLMNAFNTVNLAAVVIVTSTKLARAVGISEKRWIYPLGGAGTRDSNEFWKRPTYWWSPAISRSLDAGLEVCGLQTKDIDMFDFYSCFPIVPKLACQHLGLPIIGGKTPITLLGGLTSFGGAGNNYSMHAINETVRRIRRGKGKTGLVLANGGLATYEFVICLSKSPRKDGLPYPDANPLPDVITDVQVPSISSTAEGDATIETYTVEYDREGRPYRGYVIGRLKSNGHRFVSNHADDKTLLELSSTTVEPIGRSGSVKTGSDGRNLFTFNVAKASL